MNRRRESAGMVLPVVLLLLALMGLLVMQAQLTARARLLRERRATQRARLRIMAADAAWETLARLPGEVVRGPVHTNAAWARPREMHLAGDVVIRIRVTDAERYFNVNNLAWVYPETAARAPVEVVEDLLRHAGCERPAEGARRLYNRLAGHDPQEAARAFFQGLGELAENLPDASPARLAGLFAVLPVDESGPRAVNVNTAPPEVIRAVLGENRRSSAAAMISRREQGPFAALADVPGRTPDDDVYLAVRSDFFMLRAEASDGADIAAVWALAEIDMEGVLHVRRWVCR